MRRILTNIEIDNLPKIPFHTTDKEIEKDVVVEPDFAELHALFEIQYEQFINDTSDEIAERTQKLLELPNVIYRNSSPG